MRQADRLLLVTAMACGLLFLRIVAAQEGRERSEVGQAARRAFEKQTRARAAEQAKAAADSQITRLEVIIERLVPVAVQEGDRESVLKFVETHAFTTVDSLNQGRTRQRFIQIRDDRIAEAREAFGLTPAQESRLRLGAEGDMKRHFDDLDRAREQLRRVIFDADNRKPVLSEIRRLRVAGATGPFGEGSIYAKVLEKIRREQVIAEN